MDQIDQMMVGWTTVASGLFWILQLVALILLFTGRYRFGPVSDFSSAMSAILLIPLALSFRGLLADSGQFAGSVALLLGMIGMLAVATTGFLMVSETIEFRTSLPPVMIGMGLIGLWMVINSYRSLDQPGLPSILPWLGILVGVTLALALPTGLLWSDELYRVMSGIAGQGEPTGVNLITKGIVYIAGPINQLLFPVWAFWFGRLFLSGQIG